MATPTMRSQSSLDGDFDHELSRWGCRAARAAWVAWGAIVVAALFGFLGDGPVSGARARSPNDAVAVTYKRFVHYHHPEELKFVLQPRDETSTTVALTLSDQFLDSVEIDRIEPIPIRNSVAGEDVTFHFARSSTRVPTEIVFHLQYDTYGKVRGSARIAGDDPVRFMQTVYP